jgi:hypothetical protein
MNCNALQPLIVGLECVSRENHTNQLCLAYELIAPEQSTADRRFPTAANGGNTSVIPEVFRSGITPSAFKNVSSVNT